MRKSKLRTALCALLAGTVLTAFAALAADAGGRDDPLVTLSYLTGAFTDQVLEKVDKALEERGSALRRELEQEIAQAEQALRDQLGGGAPSPGGGAAYAAVTLSEGQTLQGSAGCEVILRSGSAVCAASGSPGLVDATSGGSLSNGGSLQQNHLYLMPDAQGVRASGAVTLLVRGSYSIL